MLLGVLMKKLTYIKDMEEDCDLCGVDNNGYNLRIIGAEHYINHLLCLPCAFRAWYALNGVFSKNE